MWDRAVNFVYKFIRDLPSATFYILMGIVAALAFYFLSLFLKANKKESPNVYKISYLLMAVFLTVVIVLLSTIRY